jgi:hypothetical protein
MARLTADHKEYWTSDDFRGYGLDKLMDDPQHEIGAYFAKLKFHGFVVAAGEEASAIESNNRRKVDLMRWHSRVEGWVHMRILEDYCRTEVKKNESNI